MLRTFAVLATPGLARARACAGLLLLAILFANAAHATSIATLRVRLHPDAAEPGTLPALQQQRLEAMLGTSFTLTGTTRTGALILTLGTPVDDAALAPALRAMRADRAVLWIDAVPASAGARSAQSALPSPLAKQTGYQTHGAPRRQRRARLERPASATRRAPRREPLRRTVDRRRLGAGARGSRYAATRSPRWPRNCRKTRRCASPIRCCVATRKPCPTTRSIPANGRCGILSAASMLPRRGTCRRAPPASSSASSTPARCRTASSPAASFPATTSFPIPRTRATATGATPNPRDEGTWNDDGECVGAPAEPSVWHGIHVSGIIAAQHQQRRRHLRHGLGRPHPSGARARKMRRHRRGRVRGHVLGGGRRHQRRAAQPQPRARHQHEPRRHRRVPAGRAGRDRRRAGDGHGGRRRRRQRDRGRRQLRAGELQRRHHRRRGEPARRPFVLLELRPSRRHLGARRRHRAGLQFRSGSRDTFVVERRQRRHRRTTPTHTRWARAWPRLTSPARCR